MERSLSGGVVLGLVGWLAVMLAQAARTRPREPEGRGTAPEAALELVSASARELRRLPGIGEVRALEIVRERWRRRGTGEEFQLAALPGIGETTAERVEEALRAGCGSGAP